jgi:hypothetical protein
MAWKYTYTVPDAVAENARRALEVRASKPESERGMTRVGLARANQLANQEPVSIDTLRRMIAYFARHEVDKQGSTWDQQGKGWQAWYGWGGDEGREWAESTVKEVIMNEKKNEWVGDQLSQHQLELVHTLQMTARAYGKFDKSAMANGSHYTPAEANPFKAEGIVCENCVFYRDGQCDVVEGEIEDEAICKLWVIPEAKIGSESEVMAESEPVEVPAEDVAVEEVPMDNEEMKVVLSTAEREAMPDEDFAIPSSRNFPIDSPVAVRDAVASWGRYQGPVAFETFKRNLIKIAMRKGPEFYNALPQSWRDELAAATKDLARELLKRIQ